MTMQPAWKKKPGSRAIDICANGHAAHATGERRQAVVRLAAALIFGLYLLGMHGAGWRAEVLAVVPVFAACVLVCLLFGLALLISPAYSKPRCLLSIVADQASLALLVFGSGAIGAPFLWCPIAAAIAGGLSSGALYKAEADGKLSFVRLAGRTMVTTESLKRFIGSAQPWVKSDRGKEARAKRSERAKMAWQG